MKTNTTENITKEDERNGSVPPAVAGGILSDAETNAIDELRNENEILKSSIRFRDAHDSITKELVASGARSPGLLFQMAKDNLQFDDEGKPANTAAIVRQLRIKFPEQFGYDRASGSVDGGAGASGGNRSLTKETLAKMSPAEIAKLDWADVRSVLANG